MSLFGDNQEEVGKPVTDDKPANYVADARTKTPENEPPAEKTDAEKAAEAEALNAGKTPEEIETERIAAEKLAKENEGKTPEGIEAAAKEATAKAEQADMVEKIRKEAQSELLKKYGVTTEAELEAKLNPAKPLTEEEKKAQENIYTASLAKFAVENKVFDNEEWLAYNNMIKMPNTDLVFKDFASSYKEFNKERKDAEGKADPVTDDELKDKFNELYHVDSTSSALKEQGQKNIDLKATALKQPLENKFNDIKSIYDNELEQKRSVPAFRTFFKSILNEAIPTSLEYGEGENKIAFDLSKIDKDEIEQFFIKEIGDREFTEFMKGKGTPQQREKITREITKELLYRNHKEIAKLAFESGSSIGLKKGAIGGKAPFVEPQKREVRAEGSKMTQQDSQKIAANFKLS